MSGAVTMVRIYIKEADHGKRGNLMQEILRLLHDQHRVAGFTVFRGIAGFGTSGEVHAADILRLNVDLPLVIEFFDTPKVVDAAIKLIRNLVPPEHIVLWNATTASATP
jgi:PII-like signaling protein